VFPLLLLACSWWSESSLIRLPPLVAHCSSLDHEVKVVQVAGEYEGRRRSGTGAGCARIVIVLIALADRGTDRSWNDG